MEGVSCMDACFDGADLSESDLYWCIAFGASFRQAKLMRASLRGADLKGTDLSNADLTDADLGIDNVGGATQLQGAILTGAQLVRVRLGGAEYDDETRFPEGFDPAAAGMVYVGAAA
jgi:uncharacterized protein YjbI with pentapeptide repeats